MIKPSAIATNAVKLLAGDISVSKFISSVVVAVVVDAVITQEVLDMDLLYIPDGYTIWIVLIVGIISILGPIICALYRKNSSKGKYDDFDKKYAFLMIADMIVTPSIGLIVLSIIVQELPIEIDPVAYLVLLPIALFATSYYTLKAMCEGFKGTFEQVKKDVSDIKDGVEQLKQ